jgi:hypothetical protein
MPIWLLYENRKLDSYFFCPGAGAGLDTLILNLKEYSFLLPFISRGK